MSAAPANKRNDYSKLRLTDSARTLRQPKRQNRTLRHPAADFLTRQWQARPVRLVSNPFDLRTQKSGRTWRSLARSVCMPHGMTTRNAPRD